MGRIAVHEFVTLDGVIEDPAWTFDYPLDPKMGEAIAAVMGRATPFCWEGVRMRSSPRRGAVAPLRTIRARRS